MGTDEYNRSFSLNDEQTLSMNEESFPSIASKSLRSNSYQNQRILINDYESIINNTDNRRISSSTTGRLDSKFGYICGPRCNSNLRFTTSSANSSIMPYSVVRGPSLLPYSLVRTRSGVHVKDLIYVF